MYAQKLLTQFLIYTITISLDTQSLFYVLHVVTGGHKSKDVYFQHSVCVLHLMLKMFLVIKSYSGFEFYLIAVHCFSSSINIQIIF